MLLGEIRFCFDEIGIGILVKRDVRLKVMRIVSIFESYEGVNGGLDFGRKFKKKGLDEDLCRMVLNDEMEEYLVYIYYV